GAKTFLLPGPLPGFKYGLKERVGPFLANLNAGAMSSAWKVDRVREMADRPEVIRALLDPRVFLEQEAFTEKAPGGGSVVLSPARRSAVGQGPSLWEKASALFDRWFKEPTTITENRPSPCEAQFEVSCERPGYLVFDESFSPGWHAWVDGRPVPIFRADALFMAVPLSQGGLERVMFRYEPNSFRLGLFLSLLTWFGLAFGCFWRRLRD
ncbi:MAG TPA: YfhO family protein, partial [bacterium]|nr:YfhO family protein [bacterium]